MPESRLENGWARVAFGDVVELSRAALSRSQSGRVRALRWPRTLDPGDLTIRRWGDVAGWHHVHELRFEPGQVLFGKRRAYQRKVAVADFDGVCSGDIYVLRAERPRLLPEFLPFICQTDGFIEHAVGHLGGSLSPRPTGRRWRSYEFVLPPLEEQRRIAALLGATQRYRQLDASRCYKRLSTSQSYIELFQRRNETVSRCSSPLGDLTSDSAESRRRS